MKNYIIIGILIVAIIVTVLAILLPAYDKSFEGRGIPLFRTPNCPECEGCPKCYITHESLMGRRQIGSERPQDTKNIKWMCEPIYKKYRLIKDTPKWKAGIIFVYYEDREGFMEETCPLCFYISGTETHFMQDQVLNSNFFEPIIE